MKGFGPVITTMATPFDEYNQLNMESLRRLLLHLIRHQSSAIVVTGTTGEAPTLSATERLRVWETAVDFAGPLVPVIAGVGTNNTRTTLHNIKLAEEAGVDGLLLVAPYYNQPTQEGLLAHFKQATSSTDLPILLYNAPARTGVGFEIDTLAELMEEKNIVGLVDSSQDLSFIREAKKIASANFSIYAGDDKHYLEALKAGANGVVSVAAHVVGKQMSQIFEQFSCGRLLEAEAIDASLRPVYEGLRQTTNPAPIKAVLNEAGFFAGGLRLPLVPLDRFEAADLYESIRRLLDE